MKNQPVEINIDTSNLRLHQDRIDNLVFNTRYKDRVLPPEKVGAVTLHLQAAGHIQSAALVRTLWDISERRQRELDAIKSKWWYRLFVAPGVVSIIKRELQGKQ